MTELLYSQNNIVGKTSFRSIIFFFFIIIFAKVDILDLIFATTEKKTPWAKYNNRDSCQKEKGQKLKEDNCDYTHCVNVICSQGCR